MNLILIYGPPAAGKLTVAKIVSEMTGFTLLDNHRVVDYLERYSQDLNPALNALVPSLDARLG